MFMLTLQQNSILQKTSARTITDSRHVAITCRMNSDVSLFRLPLIDSNRLCLYQMVAFSNNGTVHLSHSYYNDFDVYSFRKNLITNSRHFAMRCSLNSSVSLFNAVDRLPCTYLEAFDHQSY